MTAGAGGDDGFALVAALGAAMLFALVAYAVLAADRGAIAALDAQLTRARLEAAADAGVATALEGLGAAPGRSWPIDGRRQSLLIDDLQVEVAVEDERGKVSLSALTPDQARRLFMAAGVAEPRLTPLTASVLNWQDAGQRDEGAKPLDYVGDGLQPRGAAMHAVSELMAVKGMDPEIYARVAPVLTVFFGYRDGFDSATASPLALQVMAPDEAEGPRAGPQSPAGSRPAIATDLTTEYLGRPFTVRVVARDGRGGTFQRVAIVELTGQPRRPYWVRAVD